MQPVTFKQAYSQPLKAGDNPNTGDLPICIARDPATLAEIKPGDPRPVAIISCWQLSPEELEEVNRTGVIYIGVMASEDYRTQPPIYAMGLNPFERHEFQAVPRSLYAEREEALYMSHIVQNFVIEKYKFEGPATLDNWVLEMGPVWIGTIENMVRAILLSGTIDVTPVIMGWYKRAVFQKTGSLPDKIELPKMLTEFINDVLRRIRQENAPDTGPAGTEL